MQVIIIVLIVIILLLVIIGMILFSAYNRQLNYYKTVSNNVTSMSVIQQMFTIMGDNVPAKEKIEKLNRVILEEYGPKYSTISIYDGTDYEIKSTNVDEEYVPSILNVAEENDFKQNSIKNVSKYLSTTMDKTLTYKSAIERQIRSAMFSPIYYNNMYLGFWIMEDTGENSFDKISKDELAKLKNNLGVFLEVIRFQDTIEEAENIDKQTGYHSNIYLYSNVRKEISKFDSNSFTIIALKDLIDINEKYGRNLGNALIIKISNAIKETVTSDAILIRYSGIKLLIINPDSNAEITQPLIERIFNRIKNEVEYINDEKIYVQPQAVIHTVNKQNNIEKELQKMISYIDEMNDINTIKII